MQSLPYEMLGGENGVRALTDSFYDFMETASEVADIRRMHADDLAPMKEKLFLYLSEWLGGPRGYSQKTGSMCLTEPHQPYAIGEKERDQWLVCMRHALGAVGATAEVTALLEEPFFAIADFTRTQ
jgi:hemoglobin